MLLLRDNQRLINSRAQLCHQFMKKLATEKALLAKLTAWQQMALESVSGQTRHSQTPPLEDELDELRARLGDILGDIMTRTIEPLVHSLDTIGSGACREPKSNHATLYDRETCKRFSVCPMRVQPSAERHDQEFDCLYEAVRKMVRERPGITPTTLETLGKNLATLREECDQLHGDAMALQSDFLDMNN